MSVEVTEVLCRDCDLPAFRDGFTFWCPGCDKSLTVEVPRPVWPFDSGAPE